MALINKDNLDKRSLSNAEVLAILNKISAETQNNRVLDVIENLTGNRYFEDSKVDKAENSLDLKLAKADKYKGQNR